MFSWTAWIFVLMMQRSGGRMLVENCGSSLIASRIVNGVDAEREAAAWMAAIRNADRFQCGGTVIHRTYLKHTILNMYYNYSVCRFVMLGAYNKSRPAQEYSVSLAVMHHGYSNINMKHDIGLLKLSQDIQFGLEVYPICIIQHPMMKSRVESMATFEAYGWGKTKTNRESELLQQVTLHRIDRSRCNRYLQNNPLTSNQLCVGSRNRDTCWGDSGGPLTKKLPINGQELQIQVALVSFGRVRCDGEGVYTDVSSYADWIQRTINEYEIRYTTDSRLPGHSPNRLPPGFATKPPSFGYVTNPSSPQRFSTPKRSMFLYYECGGDDISMNLLVKIYGTEFEGNGVMITDRKVASIIKHPDFSGNSSHDIALLKLTKPVSLSGNFSPFFCNILFLMEPTLAGKSKPICMLLQSRHRQQIARSPVFTVFDHKASGDIPLEIHPVHSSECSTRINHKIEQDQLCIEEPKTTQKYGHPGEILGISVPYNGKDWYILFGIVSYSSNGLIILTNVMKYTSWITDRLRND
ncbi:hypothetical protein KR038_002788 [Drosophila bunnanda]|nr:hypothetical protein KR038_002788 [Drosophila bunnanda]